MVVPSIDHLCVLCTFAITPPGFDIFFFFFFSFSRAMHVLSIAFSKNVALRSPLIGVERSFAFSCSVVTLLTMHAFVGGGTIKTRACSSSS